MSHDVLRGAIISKRSVTAHSPEGLRHFSPHALGREGDGTEVVIAYQYAGEKAGGLPAGGAWCALLVNELTDARVNDDEWQPGKGEPPRDDLASIEVWNF